MPSALATDVADAELNAIKAVFPDVPAVLCIFHVKKAWINKIYELGEIRGDAHMATRTHLRQALDQMMAAHDAADAEAKLQKFYKDFGGLCPKFVAYFKSTWACNPKRMARWVLSCRDFCLKGQHTTASAEATFSVLKRSPEFAGKRITGRRLD